MTPSARGLKQIAGLLDSDKTKERQDGYSSVRGAFAQDSHVLACDVDGDGRSWLFIFQSLFGAVLKEKGVYLKKGVEDATPIARRRLADSASVVRWLVERSVSVLRRSAVKALIDHLYQTMIHRGALLEPVALDYAKALRTLLGYQPHLDHVDDERWKYLLHFSFSVMLDERLITHGTFEDEDVEEDSAILEQDKMEVDELLSPSEEPSMSKKRPRTAEPSSSTARTRHSSQKPNASLSVEQIEFAGLIRILSKSSSTPYISSQFNDIPGNIMRRFRSFYAMYTGDSSAHHDMLVALNEFLSHLSLNALRAVSVFGHRSWNPLLGLWNSRHKSIKEQLAIAFRYFLPVVTSNRSYVSNLQERSDVYDKVRHLCRILEAEADASGRTGLEPLVFDQLRLEIQSDGVLHPPFHLGTLRSGNVFSEQQAITWGILELHADCLSFLLMSYENSAIDSSSRASKRQKIEEPLAPLLHTIELQLYTTQGRVYRCQVLLFFLERHWAGIHAEFREKICHLLQRIIASDDLNIQPWALLCVSAVAWVHVDFQPPLDWDTLWSITYRRWNVPSLSRASCHAAYSMVRRGLVSHKRFSRDLEHMANEISVQGPLFPYDSVCAFIRHCAQAASRDLRLYNTQFGNKALGWLVENWNVVHGTTGGFNSKSKLEAHSIGDVLSLVAALLKMDICDVIPSYSLLPQTAMVEALSYYHRVQPISSYLHDANVSPMAPSPAASTFSTKLADPNIKPSETSAKFSLFLERTLAALILEWEGKDLPSSATPEKLRRCFDHAVLALYFQATSRANGYRENRKVLQTACNLIGALHHTLAWDSWTPHDRTLITIGLAPLTYANDAIYESCWTPLTQPTEGSGMPYEALCLSSRRMSSGHYVRTERSQTQHLLWEGSEIQESLLTLSKSLELSLFAALDMSSAQGKKEDIDEFAAAVRRQAAPGLSLTGLTSNAVLHSTFRISLSILTAGPMLQMQLKEPPGEIKWVDMLEAFEDERCLVLGPALFAGVARRECAFGLGGLDRVMSDLSDRLRNPKLSHNATMHMLVASFLRSTMHLWLDGQSATTVVGRKTRAFMDWLIIMVIKGKCQSWRVRDAIAMLLDEYVSRDPELTFWHSRDEDEPGANEDPILCIQKIAEDPDVRVRYRGIIAAARLFRFARTAYSSPYKPGAEIEANYTAGALYSDLISTNAPVFQMHEHHLIRLLLVANVMISSSEIRSQPYADMLAAASGSLGVFDDHVGSLLSGVVTKIGFSSLKQLFETYAASVTQQFHDDARDISRLPALLLGYSNRRESAGAILRLGLPSGLLEYNADNNDQSSQHFRTIASLANLSPEAALNLIFPMRVAFRLCASFDVEGDISPFQLNILWDTIVSWASSIASDGESAKSVITRTLDSIVSSMLLAIGQVDVQSDLLEAIRDSIPDIEVRLLATSRFEGEIQLRLHRPCAPLYHASAVLHALRWLESNLIQELPVPETLYHVTNRLFNAITASPLINEQLRGLNAVCILCATYSIAFKRSQPLLRRIMFGACSLLNEADLTSRAQSILQWACEVYETVGQLDLHFPELLGRMASAVLDLSNYSNAAMQSVASNAEQWLIKLATDLQTKKHIGAQVRSAVYLWPTVLVSSELIGSYGDIAAVLTDNTVSSNKFRLVQRLRSSLVDGNTFQPSSRDFWLLKHCLPRDRELLDVEIDAFLDVLSAEAGTITPFQEQFSTDQSLGQRHQLDTRPRKSKRKSEYLLVLPDHAIMLRLVERMHSPNIRNRDAAYRSLRLILSLPKNYLSDWKNPPGDIPLLASRHIDPLPNTDALIASLNTNHTYVKLASNYSKWIKEVTQFLCHVLSTLDSFYAQLRPVIEQDETMATELFPVVVHSILRRQDDGTHRQEISEFFRRVLQQPSSSLSAVRAVVEVALHLRSFHNNPMDQTATGNNRWLTVDHPLLSTAATRCGAYTTALLFLELGAELAGMDLSEYMPTQEDVLYDIYSHIEEPDGFYGIKPRDVSRFLVRRFRHENEWDKAFRFDGAAYEALPGSDRSKKYHGSGVVHALHASGLDSLASTINQSIGHDDIEMSPTDLELAWRTENWDVPIGSADVTPGVSLFTALRAIHRDIDFTAVIRSVNQSLRTELGYLRVLGNESMVEVRSSVRRLLCLREAKEWVSPPVQQTLGSKDWSNLMVARWERFPDNYSFPDTEAIMATRVSLIRSAHRREKQLQIGNMQTPLMISLRQAEKGCLQHVARAARGVSQPQIALKCISQARHIEGQEKVAFDISHEFANVLWMHGEEKMAIEFVGDLLRRSPNLPAEEQALAISQQGGWLAEACLKPPLVIRNSYFDLAKRLGDKLNPPSATVPFRYGLFAERQFQAMIGSDETEQLRRDVKTKAQEVSELQGLMKTHQADRRSNSMQYQMLSQDHRRATLILAQDEQKFELHTSKLDVFLRDAITMFGDCLRRTDDYDADVIPRLCSLWFRNFSNPKIEPYITSALAAIPSRKYAFFAHQLTALLSTPAPPNPPKNGKAYPWLSGKALQDLVLELCREHPFHILYQLHALRMGDGAEDIQSDGHSDPRREAASLMLNRLRGKSLLGDRLRSIEKVCEAYIEWATWEVPSPENASQSTGIMPSAAKLVRLEAPDIPIPTLDIPIDATLKYKNIVGIKKHNSAYRTSGGINLPKIQDCVGTDGRLYKQVFKGAGGEKGGDDLRQDAVIRQVFALANQLLRKDRQTRHRDLSVRMYNVIPLTTQAGVIEFVKNSQPLQEWLSHAHKIYHPTDVTLSHGQAKLKELQSKELRSHPSYPEKILKLFKNIRARFHPVLRHYFMEKHFVASSWFEMRLCYSRSAAVSSIVGHVVGLGDRHISNILIDQASGELVHIDLGIAFDQGQLLPIPERVPFRLTSDIVDGLGMAGTEGVFRRCAEETLRVLRDRSEVLETALQVFKHDPLHSWTANPFKLRRAQGGVDTEEGDTDKSFPIGGDNADRAIRSVLQKLDKSLSVQCTVNELIMGAMDEHNLSQIFGGWSPHA